MPIWTLTPAHTYDASWQRSSHHDAVMVRAADETSARHLAAQCFGSAVSPGGSAVDPWHHLATCVHDEHSDYPEEGPVAVLWPEVIAGHVDPRDAQT
jgi:hypothetical protein